MLTFNTNLIATATVFRPRSSTVRIGSIEYPEDKVIFGPIFPALPVRDIFLVESASCSGQS